MKPLPAAATDDDVISFLDRWVERLEQDDYVGAFEMTDLWEHCALDPEWMRETVKAYEPSEPDARITLHGDPDSGVQRKEVDRWPETAPDGRFGHVWYDLSVNGKVSDLTATFFLKQNDDGVTLELEEFGIH